MSSTLPKLFDKPEDVLLALGEAMSHPAYGYIIDALENFEVHTLVVGIDDPDKTKDFLRGAVFAARSLRTQLLSAKELYDSQNRREKAELVEKQKREREFLRPGGGPAGLS